MKGCFKVTNEIFRLRSRTILAVLMLAFLQFSSCTTLPKNQAPEPLSESTNARPVNESMTETARPGIEEKCGIRILSIRPSAAGQMIDFRYQVLDSEKASLFLKRQVEPYLIDQETGARLPVPRSKLGPLRQTSVRSEENRHYFILFGNPGGLVKRGSKVTLVIGDQKIENLVVE